MTDTGVGIAEGDRERIFEEFQQVDSSSTRKKGGTGLGLAIARRIVELHGGRIWVELTPGQGSTFAFTLPLSAKSRRPRHDRGGPMRRRSGAGGGRQSRPPWIGPACGAREQDAGDRCGPTARLAHRATGDRDAKAFAVNVRKPQALMPICRAPGGG